MTVAALTQTRAQIAGDGVTDRVDVTFQFVNETDLKVIHTDSGGTDTEWIFQESPGSWYFSGGDYAAGTIHFSASDLAVGERLTVLLTSQYDQALSLDGGEIDPSVLERGMDRAALQIQSIAGEVGRALRVSPSLSGTLPDLEVPDLPDGHTFVREGDELIPALIDSAAISTAVTAAQSALASAETAQSEAELASETAESAASNASTSENNAGLSAGSADVSATAAATSADAAAQSAAEAATNAADVLETGRIPVGAMMPWASPKAPNQFWLLITEPGQVYSRATYPALHDVLAPEYTVTNTSGSTVVTGIGSGDHIGPGKNVEGTGIPANTFIVSVDGASQVTLSAATTANVTDLRVFPWGNGDGSTTSNFPPSAGRVHRGLDSTGTVNPDASGGLEVQDDAFQGHQHAYGARGRAGGGNSNDGHAVTSVGQGAGAYNAEAGSGILDPISDGVNGTPRTASETRAKAWISPYIIKVADGVDDPEILTAVQVVQDTATALSKALANEAEVAKSGSVAVLQYQQPFGINGGIAASGARQTYPLNTELYDPNEIISLSSFQFTAAVDMEIDFWAIFYNTAQTKLYLRNITDGVDVADSGKAYIRAGSFSTGQVSSSALLEAGKTYELQYEVAATKTSNGLGVGAGTVSGVEIYGQLNARAI